MGIPMTRVGDKKDNRIKVDDLAFSYNIAIVIKTKEMQKSSLKIQVT